VDREEAMARSFAACETWEQARRMAGLWAVADLLVEILTTPPPVREHWWQFWRMRA
jgi:hypothetical protein